MCDLWIIPATTLSCAGVPKPPDWKGSWSTSPSNAPAWAPVVEAIRNLEKGGRLIINAIRKENKDREYLQNLSYQDHLWMEKNIKSVANLTAKDVSDFLELAEKASIKPEYQLYPLEQVNKALIEVKEQKIRGAKVLQIS